MDLLTPVFSILALLVIIKVIQVLITWGRLIRWRFRLPTTTLTEREAFPAEFSAVFQSAEQSLTSLGFRYSHSLLQDAPIGHVEQQQAIQVFVHEESQTYAEVTPNPSPEFGVLFNVSFTTVLTDGHAIVTVDCLLHSLFLRPTWCHFSDYYVGNIARQWEEHQHSLKKTAAVYLVRPCSPRSYLEYSQRFLREYITKNPILTPAATPREWRVRHLPALLFSWRLLQGLSKGARVRKAAHKAHGKGEGAPSQVPNSQIDEKSQVASEVAAFERMQEVQDKAPGWSWLAKCVLLLVSVAIAGLSFGLTFSPSFVAILLGVLFFHELGHWFGMWLFGYRDRQMFFIPFLGAAVTGEKEDATPMQQLIVALLGPVPGLLLGMACFHWASGEEHSWLSQVAWVAISLNYINLLPINPLDGGRVVDILLSRFPWLRFAFGIASVLILLLAGLSGMSLMAGIAVAMMFTLVTQWRTNIALRRIRQLKLTPKNRAERLKAIFQVFAQSPFQQLAVNTRYELAKALLRHLTTGPAYWRTMTIGGTMYAVALMLPVYIGVKTTMATVSEHVATMDTLCEPHTQPRNVKAQTPQEILEGNAEEPAITIQRIAGYLRTKVPCVAEFKTYDLALLNSDERLFWDLYWFHMKVALGGFRQYFANDAAKVATLRAQLERIGAEKSLRLVDRSLDAFPDNRIPETPEAIATVLQQIDENDAHPAHALWQELDEEYREQHVNELQQKLLAYVREFIVDFSPSRTLVQAASQPPASTALVEAKPIEGKAAAKKPGRRH